MDWNDGDACMPISLKYYDLVFDFNAFGFNHSVGDIYGVSDTLLDGGWHHVTAVFYDAQGYENAHDFEKLYIDGVAQSLSYQKNPNAGLGNPTPNNVNFSYQELKIGTIYPWDNLQFNGNMDELSIWNGELSASKIRELANCKPVGTEPNLVGYWNMENGSGTTLYDQTSNGYNGQITDALWSTSIPQITCNNCTATDSIYVQVQSPTTLDLGSDTILICAGTIETLDAGTGFSFSLLMDWLNQQTLDANTAGMYKVTGTILIMFC